MISEWTNHVWQSTIFLIAAGLLTVAFRKNRAQVRYWLWFSASVKFLIPFSLLMDFGSYLQWSPAAQKIATQIATPAITFAMDQFTRPFHIGPLSAAAMPWTSVDRATLILLAVWMFGFGTVAVMRLRVWRRVRNVVRSSTPMEIASSVPVHSHPGLLEPGVVGFWHPVLLLPADIQTRLTSRQLEAVLAHELCHVRRRDNLMSAIHMIVEAVFWFHPLVWWIGVRLVDERERACDEEVLRLGNEPQVYAEGILNVCRIYLESPLRCVSGVTGSDLRKRIHAIVTGRVAANLSVARKASLVTAAIAALAAPLVVGMIVSASPTRTLSQAPAETPAKFAARDSLNKGVQAFKAQQYDTAIDHFKKAIELDPELKDVDLYLATGYVQKFLPHSPSEENQKFADLAVQTFQRVLDRNPTNKIALAGIASIYQNNDQYDKAREAYIRNAQADPGNHIPFYAVGAVDWIIVHNAASLSMNQRSGLIAEGLEYLDKAITINPEYEDSYWYENLLIREQSGILKEKARQTQDTNEASALLATAAELDARADDWSNRALEVRKRNAEKARALGVTGNGK